MGNRIIAGAREGAGGRPQAPEVGGRAMDTGTEGIDRTDVDGTEPDEDAGWSPPERTWGVGEWGTTAREESAGEGLRGRLARELPDGDGDDDSGDGLGDSSDTDGELIDDEVGGRRAGRLVEDDGSWDDEEPELHAEDVGIDTGAASAEEAAVHVVPDRDDDRS